MQNSNVNESDMNAKWTALIQLKGVRCPDGSRSFPSLGDPQSGFSFHLSERVLEHDTNQRYSGRPCATHKCLMPCRTDHIVQFVGAALCSPPQRHPRSNPCCILRLCLMSFTLRLFHLSWHAQSYDLDPCTAGITGNRDRFSLYLKKHKQTGQSGTFIQVFILPINLYACC